VRACSVGFTLIEILVVTAIIGIGLTLVVANLQPDEAQAARRDAGELAGQLEQLQERAVFGGKAVAVSFGAEGLQTWQRTPKGDWAPEATNANIVHPSLGATDESVPDRLRRPSEVPRTSLSRIGIESIKIGADIIENDARLIFLPDGVSLPFELVVARQGHRFLITGNPLGRIEMKPAT